jgi:hypothetical protein
VKQKPHAIRWINGGKHLCAGRCGPIFKAAHVNRGVHTHGVPHYAGTTRPREPRDLKCNAKSNKWGLQRREEGCLPEKRNGDGRVKNLTHVAGREALEWIVWSRHPRWHAVHQMKSLIARLLNNKG